MPERDEPAGPVMTRRASLDADQAGRWSFEKAGNIIATKLAPDNNRTGRVDAVDLKDLLRDIHTDCANLLHGRLSLDVTFDSHTMATR